MAVALAILVLLAAMALDTKVVKIGSAEDVRKPASSRRRTSAPEFPKVQAEIEKRAVDAVTLAARRSPRTRRRRKAVWRARRGIGTGDLGQVHRRRRRGQVRHLHGHGRGVCRTRWSFACRPARRSTAPTCATRPATIEFGQFTNQIEYQNAGSALNNEMKKAGARRRSTPAKLTGKTISVVGVFQLDQPEELAGHAGEAGRPMSAAPDAEPRRRRRRARRAQRRQDLRQHPCAEGRQLRHPSRPGHDAVRRERRRQVDADEDPVRRRARRPRARSSSTASRSRFASSTDARDRGISIIHQELSLAPNLSVRDNIFMGREIMRRRPASTSPRKRARPAR